MAAWHSGFALLGIKLPIKSSRSFWHLNACIHRRFVRILRVHKYHLLALIYPHMLSSFSHDKQKKKDTAFSQNVEATEIILNTNGLTRLTGSTFSAGNECPTQAIFGSLTTGTSPEIEYQLSLATPANCSFSTFDGYTASLRKCTAIACGVRYLNTNNVSFILSYRRKTCVTVVATTRRFWSVQLPVPPMLHGMMMLMVVADADGIHRSLIRLTSSRALTSSLSLVPLTTRAEILRWTSSVPRQQRRRHRHLLMPVRAILLMNQSAEGTQDWWPPMGVTQHLFPYAETCATSCAALARRPRHRHRHRPRHNHQRAHHPRPFALPLH